MLHFNGLKLIDWLMCMLLLSRFGLVRGKAVEIFHHYGVHFSSLFLM